MRKIRSFIFISILMFFTSGAWAQESVIERLQIGPNFTYNMGFGAITEHENGNAALGIDAYFKLFNMPVMSLGVSGTVELGSAVGKQDYVDNWFVLNTLVGLWLDLPVKQITIRPEISYGLATNIVNSDERNVHGAQTDQMIRVGCTVAWEPDFLKGFAIYGGANYSFMPEKDNIGHFIGFKAGMLYRLGGNSSKKTSEASENSN